MKRSAALLSALCLSLVCQVALAQDAAPNDPIARSVLPPELILQHQKAIRLTEAQKNDLIAEVKRAQARIVDVQWEVQRALEPLVESLGKDRPDETQTLAQLDKVLAAEREFKRIHIALAVRLKNILTPEQQRTLLELRAHLGRTGEPARPGAK